MTLRKVIAVLVLLALTGAALPDELTGQASVIDGDTLEIHGTCIRLWGIDAPESSQLCRGEDSLPYRCVAKSANDLDGFIARRPVSCVPVTLDRYGRTHLGRLCAPNDRAAPTYSSSIGNSFGRAPNGITMFVERSPFQAWAAPTHQIASRQQRVGICDESPLHSTLNCAKAGHAVTLSLAGAHVTRGLGPAA